ncbi:DUF421 domain-containing protein [Romboutsia sedimentorum]|uniref:DUF421 domain-containing protein n=1 Tax=Romboutsia sedimentorum TaxID=1368474 RepID=UPI0024DE7962|nr:DUF421 domain-containing protein [Romboutsia sedimentorum]MDK2586681.1 DUF421 domain-containing protein [Romboutsia sedimentorum]
MIVVLIRSILLYIVVLIGLRIMGKGEIAEMNSFDLVITLLIAEVAAVPMENNNIPIVNGIAAVTGLVFMQIVISYLALKSRTVRVFLSGKPSILIEKGEINFKILKKERVTIDELLEQLRILGYFKISDVQYAILETDGNLSVLPSSSYNSTPACEFNHLPLSLIIDGQIINNNIKIINKDINWLFEVLNSNQIENVKDVLLLTIDENDKVDIQKKKI